MSADRKILSLFDSSGNLTPEAMHRYINRQLNDNEITTIEEHLKRSDFDREALEGLKKQPLVDLSKAVAGLNKDILRAAREKSTPPVTRLPLRRRYYWVAAAGLLGIIGVGVVMVLMFRPSGSQQLAVDSQQSAESPEGEARRISSQEPVTINQEPVTINQEPVTISQEPVTINQEPLTVGGIAIADQDQPVSEQEVSVQDIPAAMAKSAGEPSQPSYTIEAGMRSDSSSIFITVESMPVFPGGEEALNHYLDSTMIYPQLAIENDIQGTVYTTFVIEKDGSVTNVQVLRGIGGGCNEEAIRLIKSMPKWLPGRQSGQPVRVQYSLPVRFN
jgi:protein TonB